MPWELQAVRICSSMTHRGVLGDVFQRVGVPCPLAIGLLGRVRAPPQLRVGEGGVCIAVMLRHERMLVSPGSDGRWLWEAEGMGRGTVPGTTRHGRVPNAGKGMGGKRQRQAMHKVCGCGRRWTHRLDISSRGSGCHCRSRCSAPRCLAGRPSGSHSNALERSDHCGAQGAVLFGLCRLPQLAIYLLAPPDGCGIS